MAVMAVKIKDIITHLMLATKLETSTGNHFHLLIPMHPGDGFSDEEIKRRFFLYYRQDDRWRLVEERGSGDHGL